MKAQTRATVKKLMQDWVSEQDPVLKRWVGADATDAYPFHRLIFSDEALVAARTERSIVTNMGRGLYPKIAEAVSKDRFSDVALERTVEGELNDAACNLIEQIVTELRAPRRGNPNHRVPNRDTELNDVINSRGGGSSIRSSKADLYIGDFPGGPLFMELKTPRPNLDIASESKRKMLYFLAMMDRQRVEGAKALMGLTYNPFVTRKAYNHPFTKQIMDIDNEVLMGSETWDYIGGSGTYDELLEIIAEINPA